MQKKISIFSFFSGIGILDLAFEKNGYNIVFVNEYDNLFIKSYDRCRYLAEIESISQPLHEVLSKFLSLFDECFDKIGVWDDSIPYGDIGCAFGLVESVNPKLGVLLEEQLCRLTHDYVFYLYKLYLEYRGRQPFQTINLIRQEDTSLPVMYNKKETGQYLSFRSVPIPDKSNRKNWCWVIDAVELNRVLMLLELPTRSGNDDIVLKDESVELRLEQNKKIRIVKAKEKVRFEAV